MVLQLRFAIATLFTRSLTLVRLDTITSERGRRKWENSSFFIDSLQISVNDEVSICLWDFCMLATLVYHSLPALMILAIFGRTHNTENGLRRTELCDSRSHNARMSHCEFRLWHWFEKKASPDAWRNAIRISLILHYMIGEMGENFHS